MFLDESEMNVRSSGSASQSHLVPDLKPYTWYSFQVRGATMEGDAILWGNWSETIEVKTQQSGAYNIYEPAHNKTYNKTCEPSEDSDQPGHLLSLISLG